MTQRETCSNRISDVYKEWQKVGKMRDPNDFGMPPSMVNAYFNPPANEVSLLCQLTLIQSQLIIMIRSFSLLGSFNRPSSLPTGRRTSNMVPSAQSRPMSSRMHLTHRAGCIISMASSSNGGRMRRARVLMRSRNVFLTSIRVSYKS